MKLYDAIILGKFCGLSTLEECVFNIERHSLSMFTHSDIETELAELEHELRLYNIGVLEIDFEAIDAAVDKELEEYETACRNHTVAEKVIIPTGW